MTSSTESATAWTSGSRTAPGTWSWPDDLPQTTQSAERSASSTRGNSSADAAEPQARPNARRHYGPRTCRICLETVEPTFHTPKAPEPSTLGGLFPGGLPGGSTATSDEPFVSYDSESGRLIRPCKCKGSSRYVHEECLQQWRHADPGYGRRNFWQCPTCGFKYRLERMQWGNWISSTTMQILLTISIFLVAVFVLGFVADPIINLYLDPYDTLLSSDRSAFDERIILDDESTWAEHFLKGMASLGLLGFVKVAFSMSYYLRVWNIGGGGRGHNGRDRLANLNWFIIIAGIITVLMAVWKAVRAWSGRVLKKAGERVVDVQGDEADNEDDADDNAQPGGND